MKRFRRPAGVAATRSVPSRSSSRCSSPSSRCRWAPSPSMSSRLYVELQRVQAAADAAATAGVTYMPDDFAEARRRARIEIAEDNGFPNSGTTTVVGGPSGDEADPAEGDCLVDGRERLRHVLRRPARRRCRASAVADFNGPAPMGSPCNTFGNEPAGGEQPWHRPRGRCSTSPARRVVLPPGVLVEHRRARPGRRTRATQFDDPRRAAVSRRPLHRHHQRRVRPPWVLLHRPGRGPVRGPAGQPRALRPGLRRRSATTATSGRRRRPAAGSNYVQPLRAPDASTRYKIEANESHQLDLHRRRDVRARADRHLVRAPRSDDHLDPRQAPPIHACVKQYPGYTKNDRHHGQHQGQRRVAHRQRLPTTT